MKTLEGFMQRQTKWASIILAACFFLTYFTVSACAQEAKINLSGLDKLASKASEVVNVNLEGPALKLAAENMAAKGRHSGKKQAEAQMLQRLKGVYVRSYEFGQPGEYSREDVENVLKQLRSGGWTSMVNVEEKKSGETTNIYMMNEGGEAVGMAIVAAEPKELTVVNLVGPIDFSELGSIGKFGKLLTVPGAGLQHRSPPQSTATNQAH